MNTSPAPDVDRVLRRMGRSTFGYRSFPNPVDDAPPMASMGPGVDAPMVLADAAPGTFLLLSAALPPVAEVDRPPVVVVPPATALAPPMTPLQAPPEARAGSPRARRRWATFSASCAATPAAPRRSRTPARTKRVFHSGAGSAISVPALLAPFVSRRKSAMRVVP
jgi:hypothetical protein